MQSSNIFLKSCSLLLSPQMPPRLQPAVLAWQLLLYFEEYPHFHPCFPLILYIHAASGTPKPQINKADCSVLVTNLKYFMDSQCIAQWGYCLKPTHSLQSLLRDWLLPNTAPLLSPATFSSPVRYVLSSSSRVRHLPVLEFGICFFFFFNVCYFFYLR